MWVRAFEWARAVYGVRAWAVADHWRPRPFHTTLLIPPPSLSQGPIYQSIECLDREGMELIEAGDGPAFRAYLELTQNTICGRYPIALFLAALALCPVRHTISFTAYDQSSHVTSVADSSVSYASAVVVAEGG